MRATVDHHSRAAAIRAGAFAPPILAVILCASTVWAQAPKPDVPPSPSVEVPRPALPPPPARRAPLGVPATPPDGGPPTPARPADPEGAAPAPRFTPHPPVAMRPADGPVPEEIASANGLSLPFGSGDAGLDDKALTLLRGVSRRLAANPRERLELRAYAATAEPGNELSARRLSLMRALAVRDRLVALGVPQQRMVVFALGDKVLDGAADRVDLRFAH